jgi:hypothetical protein
MTRIGSCLERVAVCDAKVLEASLHVRINIMHDAMVSEESCRESKMKHTEKKVHEEKCLEEL